MKKTFKGGLRIGKNSFLAWSFSWPFARLSFEDDHIEIGRHFFQNKKYTLAHADILCIRRKHGLFSKGVRIIHKAPNAPAYLLFWTTKAEEISKIFAHHGVEAPTPTITRPWRLALTLAGIALCAILAANTGEHPFWPPLLLLCALALAITFTVEFLGQLRGQSFKATIRSFGRWLLRLWDTFSGLGCF